MGRISSGCRRVLRGALPHQRLLAFSSLRFAFFSSVPRTLRRNCREAWPAAPSCAAFRMDSHESNGDDDFSFDEADESANEENILMSEIEQNYSRNGAFATASFSSSSSDSDLNSSDDDVEEEEDVEQV